MVQDHTCHHGVSFTVAHRQVFEVAQTKFATVAVSAGGGTRQFEHGCGGINGDHFVGPRQQRRQQQTRTGAEIEDGVAVFGQQRQGHLAIMGAVEGLVPQFVAITTAVKETPGLLAAALDGRLHPLHVCLEVRQGTFVITAEVEHVSNEFVLRIGAALIVDPRALPPPRDQPRFGENPQMSRDPTLSHAQDVDDLIDIEGRSRQQTQQAQARLVGEGFVDLQQIGHGGRNYQRCYEKSNINIS